MPLCLLVPWFFRAESNSRVYLQKLSEDYCWGLSATSKLTDGKIMILLLSVAYGNTKKKNSYYGRILIWKHFRGFMQPIANIISASEVWRWSFSTVKSLQSGWGKSLMSFSLGRTTNDERLVWKLLVVSEGWVSSQRGIQAEKDRCGNQYKVTKTTDLPNVFKNSLHWYPQAW